MALHKRNDDFREALKAQREEAVHAKGSVKKWKRRQNGWHNSLLSGGSANVSLAEKAKKDKVVTAMLEEDCMDSMFTLGI